MFMGPMKTLFTQDCTFISQAPYQFFFFVFFLLLKKRTFDVDGKRSLKWKAKGGLKFFFIKKSSLDEQKRDNDH